MRHLPASKVILLVPLSLAACGTSNNPTGPTTTTAPPVSPMAPPSSPLPGGPVANWTGDATVITATYGHGGPCGWGTTVGETRSGVLWHIRISGESISLEEDIPNWPTDHIPYSGTFNGARFEAKYEEGGDYLRWVCQFREAQLTGQFDAQRSTFEAIETLGWGRPEDGTTVQRRWIGRVIRGTGLQRQDSRHRMGLGEEHNSPE
jgi:hypothetical protein